MKSSKRALTVLAEGFEDIEAIAAIDVLTRAGVTVTVAALAAGPVKSAYGITLLPETVVSESTSLYDAVIFPGGRKNAEMLAADKRVLAVARRHCESGKLVAAICAAPSHVLAEGAGILIGKRATGDPAFNDRLAAAGVMVKNELVTVDGNVITGMGPGAAMLFALALTEYLVGKELADSYAQKWQIKR